MSDCLRDLAARRQSATPTQLLWGVCDAFDEAAPDSAARTLPKAQQLHALTRFARFNSLAPLLRDERHVVECALAFARQIQDAEVTRLLANALAGQAAPTPRISVQLPGQPPRDIAVDAGAATQFGGQDWGGTDLALSLAMEGFEAALLDELIAAAGSFELAPPLAVRQRAQADAHTANTAQGQTSASLLRQLVSAPSPQMEVGTWEQAESRQFGQGQLLPLTHLAYPAAAPDLLASLHASYGAAASDLLAMYALHDGAELFRYQDECGFHLVPIGQWAVMLQQAVEWAEQVTWQDEQDEIPAYLYSAIAFGHIPGDSGRWLLITEGAHAGCVMLSDSDLMDDVPRFRSIAHFTACLLTDTPRILNSGGYVQYEVDGEQLYGVRYLDR